MTTMATTEYETMEFSCLETNAKFRHEGEVFKKQSDTIAKHLSTGATVRFLLDTKVVHLQTILD